MYGSRVVAFADLTTSATVALRYGPRGGAQQPAAGNANSAAGAMVTDLAAGTRYDANRRATDGNGDTTALATRFNGQTGGGSQGPTHAGATP